MHANGTVPQPVPGTYVPIEIPTPLVPEPGLPPEVDEPIREPAVPVREPGIISPQHAV